VLVWLVTSDQWNTAGGQLPMIQHCDGNQHDNAHLSAWLEPSPPLLTE
jgi:hypothetical protein